jgi:hypothetical protein
MATAAGRWWWGAVVVGTAACKPEVLAGSYWHVQVIEATDFCNDPPKDYGGPMEMDYRLVYDNSSVALHVEEGGESYQFASGTISGCDIEYESVVWGEAMDSGYGAKWQLLGDAVFRAGGDSCSLDDLDWQGTETFEIVSTDDPDMLPGCTYVLNMEGSFVETIE